MILERLTYRLGNVLLALLLTAAFVLAGFGEMKTSAQAEETRIEDADNHGFFHHLPSDWTEVLESVFSLRVGSTVDEAERLLKNSFGTGGLVSRIPDPGKGSYDVYHTSDAEGKAYAL